MRRMVRGAWCVWGFALFLTLWLGTVHAQEGTGTISDDEVNAVARELYCPTCESTPLDVCPTQTCSDWRELIRQQLAEGKSKDEILAYFLANFGPQVLKEPPQEGFNLAVWVVPVVLIAVSGVFFALYLRRLKMASTGTTTTTTMAPPAAATPLDPYREQIEKELLNRK